METTKKRTANGRQEKSRPTTEGRKKERRIKMNDNARHSHEWYFDYQTYCYVLRCTKCPRATTVRFVDGEMPKKGQRVLIKEDGMTMVVLPESGKEAA
jgi:hypothetical protein